MQSPLQAEECLNTVLSLEKKIKDDLYLIPYTLVELALLFWEQGDTAKTSQLLEDAKYGVNISLYLNSFKNLLTLLRRMFVHERQKGTGRVQKLHI